MATQQHPAFDPNQPIVAAELPRIGGLRRLCRRSELHGNRRQRTALSGRDRGAFVERAGRRREDRLAIETKWKAVKTAIEAKLVEIRDAISLDRNEDDRRCGILFASAAALRSSLQQTKAMLKKVADLPEVPAIRHPGSCRAHTLPSKAI